MEPDLRTRFQGTWAGYLGEAMEDGPYLGLIQVAGFGNMEIIARHVLSPEELQRKRIAPEATLHSPFCRKIWPPWWPKP